MNSDASPAGRHGETCFEFDFDSRFVVPARVFGIRPTNAVVTVTGTQFVARFGRWTLTTDLDNIGSVSVTGPYRLIKVVGPPRLSASDRGLTFASNADRGVQIDFRRPVGALEPTHRLTHPNLTVTVTDPEGLAALLLRT